MINKKDALETLITSLADLKVDDTIKISTQLNDSGIDPIELMTACEHALVEIGERYAEGEYFISGLIMAGEIINKIICIVAPRMAENVVSMLKGKILIGTVKGDIHGLGKNLSGALLSAYGFEVKDLGVDVPEEEFVEAMLSFSPDIIGLSVLLTSCHHSLGDTIEALRKEKNNMRSFPIIFISGAQITQDHQKLYKADYYVETAFDTVRLCDSILRRNLK